MHAILTGSQAYGTPRESSDVDVVVRCDAETARRIFELIHPDYSELVDDELPSAAFPGFSVKQGKLNLILATDDDQFEAWRVCTEMLAAVAPCDRDQIMRVFRREWDKRGFPDKAVK